MKPRKSYHADFMLGCATGAFILSCLLYGGIIEIDGIDVGMIYAGLMAMVASIFAALALISWQDKALEELRDEIDLLKGRIDSIEDQTCKEFSVPEDSREWDALMGRD